MTQELKIIFYPDPRLKKMSKAVTEFGPELAEMARQMLELMRVSKGVGLAAPQVGKNIRMFVMNATGEAGQDRVIVNPVLSLSEGEETDEEGCLSIPDVKVDVARAGTIKLTGQDLTGKPLECVETSYVARIMQHEVDHLNGVLLTDRMGALARMTHRRVLKELEEKYAAEHPARPAKVTAAKKKIRK
jgi:peptide deformylase